MTWRRVLFRLVFFGSIAIVWLADVPSLAANNDKTEASTVDSGSFGVFKSGHRIATETFTVQESTAGKTISSEIAVESASQKSDQWCELRLSPAGDLVSYTWKEKSPGSAEITVLPQNEFLVERSVPSKSAQANEQTLLMPPSSPVVDNNFFVLRQLLEWRYLATICKTENGVLSCPKTPARMGVVVPQDHSSMSTTISLAGKDKVRIREAERELLRLVIDDDSGLWQLWVDSADKYKLIRIVMAADGTEVLRD